MKTVRRAHASWLAVAFVGIVLVAVACTGPGQHIADKIRAANSPIVRAVLLSPAAFGGSSFDRVTVYLTGDATDDQALDLWCTVMVPAGIGQLPQGAVGLYKGGEAAPGGGFNGETLVLNDLGACTATVPPVPG